MKNKIVFLYSELSDYTIKCLNFFAENNENKKIYVVHWPVNKEAPFKFEFSSSISRFIKEDVDLKQLINQLAPDLLLISGWFDKEYFSVIKNNYKTLNTVLLFDNYWEGTIKQRIGSFIFRNRYVKYFDCCWVPGEIHLKYGLKLGYKLESIYKGFYATDLDFFSGFHIEKNSNNIPKRFLYVGRYLSLKGVKELWKAFELFSKDYPDWELHCIGTGELFQKKMIHPQIFHHGFLQQSELESFMKIKGVFIMPSHYDHWGVAVQEFSAAGFPLILSDKVGANCSFLRNGENGFIFKAKNSSDLLDKMIKIAETPQRKLFEFGELSHELSKLYDLNSWNVTLNKILSKALKND